MTIIINNIKMDFKSRKDFLDFKDRSEIKTIKTDSNYFFVVFKNELSKNTIIKYFNKSFSFKMNNKFYVYFEGKKENFNIDFEIEDSFFNLEDQKTFFNYGTGFSYQLIPSNEKIKIDKDIEILDSGESGYKGKVRKWKCSKIKIDTIKESIDLINNEFLTQETTLEAMKNFNWYLLNELKITHKSKRKKVIMNIIETNNLDFDVEEVMKLEITETLCNFITNYYQEENNKIARKNKEDIKVFQLPKKYTDILNLFKKNKKIIKMMNRDVNIEKIHSSGLFYNFKNNIWLPFLQKEDLEEILQDLFFCKVKDETYLLYKNEFYTSNKQIWKIIITTISENYHIELTEKYNKEIMNRVERLANDNILEPCYKVKEIAILENGDTEKFDPKKHFPFWMTDNFQKPTEQDFKNADELLLHYVKEEKLEKIKTMLRYWFIPTSMGKKMFFIYSENANTGKTTFIENFAKGFFQINYTPLSKIEENGSSTRMNQIIQLEGEMSNNLYSSAISGKIKKKTGEKTLYAKNMHEDSKSEFNFSKFVTTTNSIPNLKEENALFSKISVIEFGVEERQVDHTFFKKNWHLVESLRRVILDYVLKNGENVIATLLSKKNDEEDNKVIVESVKIYKYCKRTNTEPKNATYQEFLLWIKDFEGDRVNMNKKQCEKQIQILKQAGIEINKNFFGHKIDETKKIDIKQFLFEKENKK